MNIVQKIARWVAPILVIALGVVIFRAMAASRVDPEREETPAMATPVTVLSAERSTHPISVRAQGNVVPARELVLSAELNGRVVWRNADLVPGGQVRRNETLVRIDPRDFRAALAQQRAQLEAQKVQVQTEERRRAVAQREWELLARQSGEHIETSEEGRSLSLREPQLRSAEASVDAIEAQIAQARLTLSRTTLRAPFNALVRSADVEVGQLVGPNAQLARLVDTDHYWVEVSLPFERLEPIRLPQGDEPGATARIYQTVGQSQIEREGRVIRLMGDLDEVGRMAHVLVEIDDPLGLQRSEDDEDSRHSRLPLLLGAFVQVEIDAGQIEEAFELPRIALRENDTVWVVDDERLSVREVEVVWRREDSVIVREGLDAGDRVVTSPLGAPVPGTLVRVVESNESSEEGDES